MRSARLFRNDNAVRVFRPFWDSSRSQKFGGSSLTKKNPDNPDRDPYEGNFIFTECDQYTKVTVIGAAGRVGKTLSLLLKTCPLIDHLCLFDTDKSVKGVGVDISHVDTKCSVSYVCGMRNIHQALDAPDVVIVAAGCPAGPNLNGRKLFEKNAPIVAGLSEACARFCPKACVVLITSPINSLLPVMGEVYQIITNRIPSRKLFGLTTLDVVRANTFVAEVVRKDPNSIIVPVIGGTSQETIVPVISQMKPCCRIKRGEMIALTECLKRAEGNLADCQNCGTRGASTLSTAYAGFRFTSSLVMALKGAENVIECAFVRSDVIPELEYLASPLKLGIRGIEFNFGYPPLSDYELAGFERAAAALLSDISLGKAFVKGIEETIQKGLVWKRLSEESGKQSEPDGRKKESARAEEEGKPERARKRQTEERKKREKAMAAAAAAAATATAKATAEGAREGKSRPLPELIEEGVVYSEGVGNWAAPAQRSLNRLFAPRPHRSCEITTESISADLDSHGCRDESGLHGGEHDEEDKAPEEDRVGDATAAPKPESWLPRGRWHSAVLRTPRKDMLMARGYHTVQEEKSGLEEVASRIGKADKFKKYLLEDRKKMLVPLRRTRQNQDPEGKPKPRPKKPETTPKRQVWEAKVQTDHYKNLNATAKQKYRSFKVQKRFTPSASVLLLTDKKKKERAGKNIERALREESLKCTEEDRKDEADDPEDEDAPEKKEDLETSKQLVVKKEGDDVTKYKEYIFEQLRQLKKENEDLKKRLTDLLQDKNLQTALQAQDKLELERTKLKACWLIMSSTMDAFSNFCKKFTSKSEDQILEEVKSLEGGDADRELEEDDEGDDDRTDKKSPSKVAKYDEHYYRFLEKLMDGHLEEKKRCTRESQKL